MAEPSQQSSPLSSSTVPGDDAEPGVEPQEEEDEEEDEDFAEGDDLAYTDDLRDENYHPSLDRWERCEGACRSGLRGSHSTVPADTVPIQTSIALKGFQASHLCHMLVLLQLFWQSGEEVEMEFMWC